MKKIIGKPKALSHGKRPMNPHKVYIASDTVHGKTVKRNLPGGGVASIVDEGRYRGALKAAARSRRKILETG